MTEEPKQEEVKQEGRGRNAAKRVAKAIEEIAQQLTELPESALAGLPLEDDLVQELRLARNTRGHGSRKRQIKHFAGRLRRYDRIDELDIFLNGQHEAHYQETQDFHNFEQLRDRLCTVATFADALTEVSQAYPQLSSNKIARLARNVHENGDKKAYREIFRQLRKASEQPE